MSSLISNAELTTQLESYIPTCSELNIISAFVTKPATNWLEDLTMYNTPLINLVGRFTPQDFISGASDINAIKDCIQKGYRIGALSNLHAKIYQIDKDIIFTGSANLTGKGLALVEGGNLESCCRVIACDNSKLFIEKIINASIMLTEDIIDKMKLFLEELIVTDSQELPTEWPETIMGKTTELFVSDFPLCKPGVFDSCYSVNASLEFAVIEKNKLDYGLAKWLFKRSKAYKWLLQIVIENEGLRDLGFGQISSLLHDALCDDPAPYRRDIKELQANLYEYVALYTSDELEIYVPGRRSQILRLVK